MDDCQVGLPKGDKLELIFKKELSLEAAAFLPFQASRSIDMGCEKADKKVSGFKKKYVERSWRNNPHRSEIPDATFAPRLHFKRLDCFNECSPPVECMIVCLVLTKEEAKQG
ncbi:hypothetical protein CW304_06275 [Bacillus sp. UFRGS-B20]|nr:hypothetical protein CW304_06275 [Bacillus sp. UFRGS-B20]